MGGGLASVQEGGCAARAPLPVPPLPHHNTNPGHNCVEKEKSLDHKNFKNEA